jgi:hypothetical protein
MIVFLLIYLAVKAYKLLYFDASGINLLCRTWIEIESPRARMLRSGFVFFKDLAGHGF